ncbi:RagB/SusD family nutrient uptake outer membrane protein [Fodinibius sp. N2]|uniref:RagB/SusD family nutrient uptake outer membrane protein n=1 Tax=Fodinibius alkaliphilus TaxID=3140241 RepID=UPI00315A6BEE
MERLFQKITTRYGAIPILVLSILFMGSCGIMDVENPNSLTEEDVSIPSSANGLKNGVLSALMTGTGWTYASISTVSDEIYWTGSYESYKTYNEGRVAFEENEITVAGYPEISEARYMSDLAVTRLEEFDSNGELNDRSILVRTYIYAALTRITIADTYDNFVFSDGRETSPPIGEENMSQLYDQAISMLNEAVSISREIENETYEMQALGVRARAKHAKGVWEKLNPKGDVPQDPLVSGTGASDDAEAALDLMTQDYKAQFNYNEPQLQNYLANQVNSRGEITLSDPFDDIKTGEEDPRVVDIQEDFEDIGTYTENYSPLTWLSAREMRLIIAEEAVGTNDTEARNQINAVRALDGLPDMELTDTNFEEFIEHERRANLYLQGRRLNDMYRFGSQSDNWLSGEDALETPGILLPIPANERLANPDV